MIFMVAEKLQTSDSVQFYVDQVQQKQGRDFSPPAGDLSRFLEKKEEINQFGKRSSWR